jgi:hypothetical protein
LQVFVVVFSARVVPREGRAGARVVDQVGLLHSGGLVNDRDGRIGHELILRRNAAGT